MAEANVPVKQQNDEPHTPPEKVSKYRVTEGDAPPVAVQEDEPHTPPGKGTYTAKGE